MTMSTSLESILKEMISIEGISALHYLPSLISIILGLVLLWLGKIVFDLLSSYSVEYQLVKADNKAITVCFVGYLAGVAIILEGVLEGEFTTILAEIISVAVWGLIGIVLLNIAGKVNDKFILRQFKNAHELMEKENVSAGVVMACGYVASAVIIRGIIVGESVSLAYDIGLTIVYFIIAQVLFILYSLLYQIITKYDFHQEIEKNNAAAGIAFGANLVAIGILLAIPLRSTFSIIVLLAWFVIGSAVIAFFRFVMDRIIIPMEKLDEEIHKDQNWGIAFLEGCFSIAAVITIQSIFM